MPANVLAMLLFALVLVLTLVVYWSGLSGPLLLDDLPQLNGLIAQSALDPGVLFRNYIISSSGPLGRPVSMATFILDAIAHGPDTWWWKYGNVMFHLISGLLVFWLTALLVKALPRHSAVDPWFAGLVVAALWLLHPLQVSTVLYTVQRMTELSTLFVFAGLVAYTKGRLELERSAIRGWLYIGIGFGVFFPLAAFSKESGVLFPVYCSLMEFIIFQFAAPKPAQKSLKVIHAALLVAYVAAALVVLVNFSDIVLKGYAFRDFTLLERVLTQFRVLVVYLSQLLVPIQLRMGFFHDDFTLSTGLFSPITTFISAILIVAFVSSAVVFRRKLPLVSFGILFFFISHAMESSIFGLELMFEHRNYIGSFGIFLAIFAIVATLADDWKTTAAAAFIGISCVAILTWQRANTWSTPASLYEYAYKAHPDSQRLNVFYTNLYAAAGEFAIAREYQKKLPDTPAALLQRAFVDCKEGRLVDEEALTVIAGDPPRTIAAFGVSAIGSLVDEVVARRCKLSPQVLISTIDALGAAKSRPDVDLVLMLFSKAKLLDSIGAVDESVAAYLEAQALSAASAVPTYRAADVLARNGRPADARAMLGQAMELELNTRIVRYDLAETIFLGVANYYASKEELQEALATIDAAIFSMPARVRLYLGAAKILIRQKRYSDAEDMLALASTLGLSWQADDLYEMQLVEHKLAEWRKDVSGRAGDVNGTG